MVVFTTDTAHTVRSTATAALASSVSRTPSTVNALL